MYFLFTDESDLKPSARAAFFIYGGIIVDGDQVPKLHSLIENVRLEAGFHAEDSLKFSRGSRPAHVSPEAHTAAKRAVIDACSQCGAVFMACATLHELARHRSREELVGWSLNTILGGFGRYLADHHGKGVVVVDKLPMQSDGYPLLREKFQVGLKFPFRGPLRLPDIVLYASSCDGASHLNSANDIVLGAFRYCVNDRGQASKTMANAVIPMMWHRKVGDVHHIREYGLFLRPKRIDDYPAHKPEYDDLVAYLQSLN